jgi:F-type H+-transporting ATPase subunit b
MNRSRRLVLVLGLFLVLFGTVLNVRAAEEASPAAEQAGQLFKWLNFAVIAGGIAYLAMKFGPRFFRGRAEQISAAITQASAAKGEADRQLQDAETRLGRLQQEVAELRAAAQRDAAAESERIRAATRNDAAKIASAALAEIESAERAAHIELRAFAAKLAVEGAETLLAKELTPKTQELLVREFVQKLDQSLAGRPN